MKVSGNRGVIAFRDVNRRGTRNYDPALQRHHILPRQLLHEPALAHLLGLHVRHEVGFEDFRFNGLLLPAVDSAAVKMALPLHRGPHRAYNGMVLERVGQIELGWSRQHARFPTAAREDAAMRLRLLQRALRRSLLDPRRRMLLSRFDPLGYGVDFADLDGMAESLWGETEGTTPVR